MQKVPMSDEVMKESVEKDGLTKFYGSIVLPPDTIVRIKSDNGELCLGTSSKGEMAAVSDNLTPQPSTLPNTRVMVTWTPDTPEDLDRERKVIAVLTALNLLFDKGKGKSDK